MNDGNPDSTLPLCVTVIHPQVSVPQAIIIEILCTSLILIGACATWDPRCAHTTDSTALRFGMAVAAISFAAVSLSSLPLCMHAQASVQQPSSFTCRAACIN